MVVTCVVSSNDKLLSLCEAAEVGLGVVGCTNCMFTCLCLNVIIQ